MYCAKSSILKVTIAAVVLSGVVACSKQDDQDPSKLKVETTEVMPTREDVQAVQLIHVQGVPAPTPSSSKDSPSTIPGVSDILQTASSYSSALGPKVTAIAKIGNALWTLVQGNQASVSLKENQISLLPCYIDATSGKCINADWSHMTGFKSPIVRKFQVVVKNGLGEHVVDYKYTISYDYGGSIDGHGQYLMNLTAINSELKVAWGFNFDAEFVVNEPTNVGTKASEPVPAITGEVRWKVKNILTNIRRTNAFWVAGDGRFKALNGADEVDNSK